MGFYYIGYKIHRVTNTISLRAVVSFYKEVKAMIYNPIFEEEIERKKELGSLKKELKVRATLDSIKSAINNVYRLFQKKSADSLAENNLSAKQA